VGIMKIIACKYALTLTCVLLLMPSVHAQMTNGRLSLSVNTNGAFDMVWEGFTDLPVNVERKSAMWQDWQVVSTNNTQRRYVEVTPPAERGFYRLALPSTISLSPSQHLDTWGIYDWYEFNTHTIMVEVANAGPGPLVVRGLDTSAALSGFSYSLPGAPFTIPAGQRQTLFIQLQVGYAYGGVYDEIYILSNATSGSALLTVRGSTYWDPSSGPNNPGGPGWPGYPYFKAKSD
jgi:hypothetical protein